MPFPARLLRTIARTALLVAAVAAAACSRARASTADGAPEIMVFAAESLRDVLADLAVSYQQATSVKVVFNFAGSQELARQIAATRGADVFLSASEDWMDQVDRTGLLLPATRTTFLSNRLVVVASEGLSLVLTDPAELADARFDVLALGDPKGVPAGQYAKAWLERVPVRGGTLWAALQERVAPCPNVRAALGMVAAHGAAVGVVYRTDAARSTRIKVLYEVPEGAGPNIRYAAAALAGRPRPNEARGFVRFLSSPVARSRFEREGFVLPPAEPR